MLQEKINNYYPYAYRVINMGTIGGTTKSMINNLYRIVDTKFKPGDIIVNNDGINEDFFPLNDYSYDAAIPLKKNPTVNCFIEGAAGHLDKEGNKLFADYIFEILFRSSHVAEQNTESANIRFMDSFALENEIPDGLVSYLDHIKKQQFKNIKGKKIGSIVMNCNPFTKGHQYLIEKSLEQVDYLYIFVVEEDRSYFKFNDRFNMVKLFCNRNSRIKVIPSGQYIISSITFAEYFDKDSLQDVSIDPTSDVTIFGEYIAPALSIKYRLVGEEPFDAVTAQYNLALKDILPNYNVDLIEITRCSVNGEIISASSVRKFMNEKNAEKLHQYLPDTTFNYLAEHHLF
jgi:[citrate (pro-3S)-lyase] ligase